MDDDIYSDLPIANYGTELDELKKEYGDLKNKNEHIEKELHVANDKLKKYEVENNTLRCEMKKLKSNFSSFFLTARQEIKRKEERFRCELLERHQCPIYQHCINQNTDSKEIINNDKCVTKLQNGSPDTECKRLKRHMPPEKSCGSNVECRLKRHKSSRQNENQRDQFFGSRESNFRGERSKENDEYRKREYSKKNKSDNSSDGRDDSRRDINRKRDCEKMYHYSDKEKRRNLEKDQLKTDDHSKTNVWKNENYKNKDNYSRREYIRNPIENHNRRSGGDERKKEVQNENLQPPSKKHHHDSELKSTDSTLDSKEKHVGDNKFSGYSNKWKAPVEIEKYHNSIKNNHVERAVSPQNEIILVKDTISIKSDLTSVDSGSKRIFNVKSFNDTKTCLHKDSKTDSIKRDPFQFTPMKHVEELKKLHLVSPLPDTPIQGSLNKINNFSPVIPIPMINEVRRLDYSIPGSTIKSKIEKESDSSSIERQGSKSFPHNKTKICEPIIEKETYSEKCTEVAIESCDNLKINLTSSSGENEIKCSIISETNNEQGNYKKKKRRRIIISQTVLSIS